MTQTAPKQKVNSTKQTKQTSVATPEIENEVSTNITEIPGVKKKKSTSANSETLTEPIQKKGNKRKKSKSKLNPPIPKELGMEVICEQTKFYNALFLVNCATPAKPSHPILANVLIIADVETQKIHLTVTDIALTIQASFAAQVLLKGEITVPVAIVYLFAIV